MKHYSETCLRQPLNVDQLVPADLYRGGCSTEVDCIALVLHMQPWRLEVAALHSNGDRLGQVSLYIHCVAIVLLVYRVTFSSASAPSHLTAQCTAGSSALHGEVYCIQAECVTSCNNSEHACGRRSSTQAQCGGPEQDQSRHHRWTQQSHMQRAQLN